MEYSFVLNTAKPSVTDKALQLQQKEHWKLAENLIDDEAKTEELIIGSDYYAVIGHFLIVANMEKEGELTDLVLFIARECHKDKEKERYG